MQVTEQETMKNVNLYIIRINMLVWMKELDVCYFKSIKKFEKSAQLSSWSFFPFLETAHDSETSCLQNRWELA